MKQLRILTGWHAGTDVTLSAMKCLVSPLSDADVQISDWTDSPLQLTIETNVAMNAVYTSFESTLLAWPDFEPRRFGPIALCVGPADAQWPADIQLLERLMRPPQVALKNAKAPSARKFSVRDLRGCGTWATAAAAAALITSFAVVVSNAVIAGEKKVAPPPLISQVRESLYTAGFVDAIARPLANRVVVEGILPSAYDVQRLRDLLSRFPADSLDHRYASATDLAQAIADALASPGLSVSYRGRGSFLVSGEAVYPERLKAQSQRLKTDLGALVEQIEFEVAELPPPLKMPVGAMLASTGLEYVQTRDGTKHIKLSVDPDTSAILH